jgi:hypothetical protein
LQRLSNGRTYKVEDMLERSYQALAHAQRARDELEAWCTEKLDTPGVWTASGLSIGMDAESRNRRDDFLYHFRTAVGFLMAVGPTIDDEMGSAGHKGWWEPLLQPHSRNLMKLRDLTLKHTNPPASAKNDIQGRLVSIRDSAGNISQGPTDIKIVASRWTWDAGPYAGENVLAVIDLYLNLLHRKVFPEAERLLVASAAP